MVPAIVVSWIVVTAPFKLKTKPAKTCLAIMVNFLLGQPAFVARIVPVHSLKGDFLTEILFNVCRGLHQEGAVITSVKTDIICQLIENV